MQNENDETPTTLLDFFVRENNVNSAFIQAFLHGGNLLRIQNLLTEQLRTRIQNPALPVVQFTDALVSQLMDFALTYRLAWENHMVLDFANYAFAEQMLDQNEARFYEAANWQRWCEQGIPDPNNVPLPLPAERTDFTAEIDSYTFANPIGYKKFPHW
jgi:hypothetical protein